MATNSYGSLCDDFYIDMYVNTELDLPTERDTLLTFFDRIHRQFPTMGKFSRRDNGEYCLEEDPISGQYRWVSLEVDRVGSGAVTRRASRRCIKQNKLVLELMPYMLGSLRWTSIPSTCRSRWISIARATTTRSSPRRCSDPSAFGSLLDLPHTRPIVYLACHGHLAFRRRSHPGPCEHRVQDEPL